MTVIDGFALLHPVLVILFVYPVLGATVRLGILVRERRLGITRQPAAVPQEHRDHGAWITGGVVIAVLIALVYSFVSKAIEPAGSFTGGALRLALLLLVALGTSVALLALVRVRRRVLRVSFTLVCWAGLLGLGSQPEVWRLSDNPLSAAFWSSHYWSGVLLCGLLLFNLAARAEITRLPAWRRLHVTSNILVLVLLAVQATTGSRDLLEIPLSWQKPAIYRCDFQNRVCPTERADLTGPVQGAGRLQEPPRA
ncbi:MAG: DUF4079 domain-containing protein [Cyanobacteriota bacterium]|nr:DUF4079 domain-containing protein [Cyanobacteriota bacterium]